MADSPRVLLPTRATSPWRALQARLVIGLSLLAAVVALVYLDRDAYIDNNADGRVGLIDAVYYSTVTITTTGYGDIVPVTSGARLFNALVITPMRILFLIVLVGTTLEVLAGQGARQWRTERWRKRMRDHVVVVGYGTKGRSAAQTLRDNGVPADQIVVIDNLPVAVADAREDGYAVVDGDGTRRDVLLRGGMDRAAKAIITADRDDAAVLITLTARAANPTAQIVVAVREEQNVPLLRQSGANSVVTSSESVGRMLGLSSVSPALGGVLEDLLSTGSGLEVAERDVQPREVGKTPQSCGDQVIAVVRDGVVNRFFDPGVTQLLAGDRLVVVRSGEELPWAARPGAEPSSDRA
ncbi:MAG TPA: potassium channel family protein [Nocardioidaceae bacterium]|nr:potassium channel family protein [Nocardioidaceae bacterium]